MRGWRAQARPFRPAHVRRSGWAASPSAEASDSRRASSERQRTTFSPSQIVTADGRVLACDRSRNADLYWACRGGGGGNFGVVTSFRFRLHPVAKASYFVLTWPWASMNGVVAAWQRFAPHAPDDLFSICRLATGGTQPSVQSFGQFFGSEPELRQLLAPLRDVPGGSLTTGTSTYLELMERWAGCKTLGFDECHLAPKGSLPRKRFAAKSDYFAKRLPPAGISKLRTWIEQRQGKGAARRSSTRTAARSTGSRQARQRSFTGESSSDPVLRRDANAADDAAALAWLRGFRAAMRPHASGHAYQNYIDPDLLDWEPRITARIIRACAGSNPSTTPTTSSASGRAFARTLRAMLALRPPSTSGPGHSPFKAVARVRIPLGAPSPTSDMGGVSRPSPRPDALAAGPHRDPLVNG